MDFHYEIKNEKLRKMVEKKAKEVHMTPDELVLAYINRGLASDGLSEEVFWELHSKEYMSEVYEALGLDESDL